MDSDDDVPLIRRQVPKAPDTNDQAVAKAVAKPVAAAAGSQPKIAPAAAKPEAAAPAAAKLVAKPAVVKPAAAAKPKVESDDDDEDEDSASSDDSGSEDDKPLSQRKAKPVARAPASAAGSKRQAVPKQSSQPKRQKSSNGSAGNGKGEKKWDTFRHAGVMFPPEYEPHGVKILYDGQPVALTPDQEEVATMYAVMKGTDYMNKPVFVKNFWTGFKELLGKNHAIKTLEKCDFSPIFDWHEARKEAKKDITKEEKLKTKEENDRVSAKYKTALVDGKPEPVGNYRVEPPGLFRGRGEHPKMGMIKKRVYPRDVVINIGKGEPIPEHPYPGQTWKEVKHDNTVTWLAYWKDTVSSKDFKYVFLGATSTFKSDSDLAKYEKARKLKEIIVDVRRNYEADWNSKDTQKRQMGTAMYFIDKLALRAGHEKDEDEADTVGCCTLKVDNIDIIPPSSIKFDFLGKDSIRYENTVEVHEKVYANIEKFKKMDSHGKKKAPGDMLFECFDATDLNKQLKNIMDGLSVKVFRTYNASVALDKLLREFEQAGVAGSVDEKKVDYDKANKEVAILCNHQRSVPKAHGTQMDKMQEKLKVLNDELAEIEAELKLSILGKPGEDGKKLPEPNVLRIRIKRKEEAISKMALTLSAKEDLKTVALGTSKINYMDPRITVAWCKRNEVPIEKIFNKSLMGKFLWAMEVEPDFRW